MQLQKLSGRLVGKRATEVELLDRVAERIRVSLKSKEPHDIYALTYFCRLLGDSGNARYTGILQLVAKDATDSGMRKHANASLKRLAKN
ncbi:MAG: hypothetical protein ACRERV_07565 [Methylococcales bacterium]